MRKSVSRKSLRKEQATLIEKARLAQEVEKIKLDQERMRLDRKQATEIEKARLAQELEKIKLDQEQQRINLLQDLLPVTYSTIFTESTHWPTLVAGGEYSPQNRRLLLWTWWWLTMPSGCGRSRKRS